MSAQERAARIAEADALVVEARALEHDLLPRASTMAAGFEVVARHASCLSRAATILRELVDEPPHPHAPESPMVEHLTPKATTLYRIERPDANGDPVETFRDDVTHDDLGGALAAYFDVWLDADDDAGGPATPLPIVTRVQTHELAVDVVDAFLRVERYNRRTRA